VILIKIWQQSEHRWHRIQHASRQTWRTRFAGGSRMRRSPPRRLACLMT